VSPRNYLNLLKPIARYDQAACGVLNRTYRCPAGLGKIRQIAAPGVDILSAGRGAGLLTMVVSRIFRILGRVMTSEEQHLLRERRLQRVMAKPARAIASLNYRARHERPGSSSAHRFALIVRNAPITTTAAPIAASFPTRNAWPTSVGTASKSELLEALVILWSPLLSRSERGYVITLAGVVAGKRARRARRIDDVFAAGPS
jgi:hypothetical protein